MKAKIVFYTQKKQPKNVNHCDNEWLLNGNVDKKVYVVCKVQHTLEFETAYSGFKKIKTKNNKILTKNKLNLKK